MRDFDKQMEMVLYHSFAECSIDYTKDSEVAYHFYATIQNRFHYAITNHTAAEIVF